MESTKKVLYIKHFPQYTSREIVKDIVNNTICRGYQVISFSIKETDGTPTAFVGLPSHSDAEKIINHFKKYPFTVGESPCPLYIEYHVDRVTRSRENSLERPQIQNPRPNSSNNHRNYNQNNNYTATSLGYASPFEYNNNFNFNSRPNNFGGNKNFSSCIRPSGPFYSSNTSSSGLNYTNFDKQINVILYNHSKEVQISIDKSWTGNQLTKFVKDKFKIKESFSLIFGGQAIKDDDVLGKLKVRDHEVETNSRILCTASL
jgi:hypothetical protein